MCILLFKPQGKKLDKDIYQNCYTNNDDGAGFAYLKDNKIFTVKGFFSFGEFWENFEPLEEYAQIVHFRVGTSGFSAGENCHPWRVNSDLVFAHNGIIPIGRQNQSWSDTGNYCEFVLKPLTKSFPDWWKQKEFKWMMEAALGSTNKLVLLDKDGHHEIFNEKEGEWDDDVWFSNKTYLYKRHYAWEGEYGTGVYRRTDNYQTQNFNSAKSSNNVNWSKKIDELTAVIDVDIIDKKLAEVNDRINNV